MQKFTISVLAVIMLWFTGCGKQLDRIEANIGTVHSDMGGLKDEVGGVKTDVAAVKTEMSALKTDVATLQGNYTTLSADLKGIAGLEGGSVSFDRGMRGREDRLVGRLAEEVGGGVCLTDEVKGCVDQMIALVAEADRLKAAMAGDEKEKTAGQLEEILRRINDLEGSLDGRLKAAMAGGDEKANGQLEEVLRQINSLKEEVGNLERSMDDRLDSLEDDVEDGFEDVGEANAKIKEEFNLLKEFATRLQTAVEGGSANVAAVKEEVKEMNRTLNAKAVSSPPVTYSYTYEITIENRPVAYYYVPRPYYVRRVYYPCGWYYYCY